jgi:hypothetical protein
MILAYPIFTAVANYGKQSQALPSGKCTILTCAALTLWCTFSVDHANPYRPEPYICTVCIRYFWQGNHERYRQIWSICTVLAKPCKGDNAISQFLCNEQLVTHSGRLPAFPAHTRNTRYTGNSTHTRPSYLCGKHSQHCCMLRVCVYVQARACSASVGETMLPRNSCVINSPSQTGTFS